MSSPLIINGNWRLDKKLQSGLLKVLKLKTVTFKSANTVNEMANGKKCQRYSRYPIQKNISNSVWIFTKNISHENEQFLIKIILHLQKTLKLRPIGQLHVIQMKNN